MLLHPVCPWHVVGPAGSPDVRGPPALQCDRSWWLLLLAVCLFALVWLYFAFVLLNDFHNFNE